MNRASSPLLIAVDGPAASDLTNRYLWNPAAVDQILAVEDVSSLTSAGDVKWPFTDHLGTPRDLATYNATTDDTSIANHRVFTSFGQLVSETNASFTIAIGECGTGSESRSVANTDASESEEIRCVAFRR